MSEITRNRIIGILFFLSLLFILWQVLFAPTLDEPMDLTTELPIAPVFEKYEVEKPKESIESILDKKQAPVISEIELTKQEDVTVKKTSSKEVNGSQETKENNNTLLDSQQLPKHWSLRIASLKNKEKVTALRLRLKKAGYRNYTKEAVINEQLYTRIYIGPKLKKDDLLLIKPKVDKMLGVDSLLVKFTSNK